MNAAGPYKFRYADIDVEMTEGRVGIKSNKPDGSPVTNLIVYVEPGTGFFKELFTPISASHFRVTRQGTTLYAYIGFDTEIISFIHLTAEQQKTALNLLNLALAKVGREQDKETIRQVISIVQNPFYPEWSK